jgi:hypothetical protein
MAMANEPQSDPNEYQQIDQLLGDLFGDRVIAFRRDLVDVAGGAVESVMLSQALYWSKTKEARERGGWFWCTHHDWFGQLGLTRSQQKTARKNLREANCGWTEKEEFNPSRTWYRVDLARLRKKALARRQSSGQIQPLSGQPQPLSGEIQPVSGQIQPLSSPKSSPKSSSESSSSSSSSSAPFELALGLRQLIDLVDDDAISKLWFECRSRTSDSTPAEILHFASERLAAKNGNIQNPMGFLLTAVPKCCEGQAFASWRERRRKSANGKSNGHGAVDQFSPARVRRYISECAVAIRKAASKYSEREKERIVKCAKFVEAIEVPENLDLDHLERRLTSAGDKLFGVLLYVAGNELRNRLDGEIKKELASYRKMSSEDLDDARTRILRPRLFKQFGLPRLTLLEITPEGSGQAAKSNATQERARAEQPGFAFEGQP